MMIAMGKKEYVAAAASALNKAAAKARTKATRHLAATYNIKPQRLVRRRMKLWRANKRKLIAKLHMLTTGMPLILLAGVDDRTASKGGVGTAHGPYDQGWIMPSKLGRRRKQIFIRKTSSRLPIESQWVKMDLEQCQSVIGMYVRAESVGVMPELARQVAMRMNGQIGGFRGAR